MENKINAMYDELYKKKQSELEKAKTNSLNELNQQKVDGETEYYNEKNKSSLANVKNVQAIRDYMARNNLLNSGENADAILRNRTDYANDIGRINSDHRNFITFARIRRISYIIFCPYSIFKFSSVCPN